MAVASEGEAPFWTPIVEYLRCPRCGRPMMQGRREVSCPEGHRFPERSGYLDFSNESRKQGLGGIQSTALGGAPAERAPVRCGD